MLHPTESDGFAARKHVIRKGVLCKEAETSLCTHGGQHAKKHGVRGGGWAGGVREGAPPPPRGAGSRTTRKCAAAAAAVQYHQRKRNHRISYGVHDDDNNHNVWSFDNHNVYTKQTVRKV